MSRFVVLINYTGDEVAQIKGLPERLATGRERAEQLGVTIESYFVTFGRFDAVAVIDAPDEPTAARFILDTIGAGPVRTETMTAITEDQIQAIANGLLD